MRQQTHFQLSVRNKFSALGGFSEGNNARFENLGDRFASNELVERLEILPQRPPACSEGKSGTKRNRFLLAYEMSRCHFFFPSLEGWAPMHGIKSKSQPKSPDWVRILYRIHIGRNRVRASRTSFVPFHNTDLPNSEIAQVQVFLM